MTGREALLRKLTAAQFATFDLHLFLDTHPYDARAMAAWDRYRILSQQLRREYEAKYGPLSADEAAGCPWLQNPWPWDICKEGY